MSVAAPAPEEGELRVTGINRSLSSTRLRTTVRERTSDGAPRTPTGASRPLRWTCNLCTFINSSSSKSEVGTPPATACAMCGTANDVADIRSSSTKRDRWVYQCVSLCVCLLVPVCVCLSDSRALSLFFLCICDYLSVCLSVCLSDSPIDATAERIAVSSTLFRAGPTSTGLGGMPVIPSMSELLAPPEIEVKRDDDEDSIMPIMVR